MSHPAHSPVAVLLGHLGVTFAMSLSNVGAAYGTAKAGVSVARLGVGRKSGMMKGFVPIVMAGILSIYGLIAAVIIQNHITPVGRYSIPAGCMHLGAGIAVGLSSLAAGYTIGIVGDSCARTFIEQDRIFTPMILMLIFSEALGLYGLILGLLMDSHATKFI